MRAMFFTISCMVIIGATLLTSCQKEIDGAVNGVIVPVEKKPKLGTTWKYVYTRYYSSGPAIFSYFVTYKAVSEEEYGGEKWLNLVDSATNITVFLLNVKADGLYQYTNNNAYILCKYPAAINETYNTYNGGPEDFTVKGVNDSIPTGINGLKVNFYEGVIGGDIIDRIWYNDNVWIARKYLFKRQVLSPFIYYRYETWVLQKITY